MLVDPIHITSKVETRVIHFLVFESPKEESPPHTQPNHIYKPGTTTPYELAHIIPSLPFGFPNLDDLIYAFTIRINRDRNKNSSSLDLKKVTAQWDCCLSFVANWIRENMEYGKQLAHQNIVFI